MTREGHTTYDAGVNGTNEIDRPPRDGSTRDRQENREPLVDLNFKVPREFRRRFRHLAADADIRNVELLKQAIESYERDQKKKTDASQR
ncbi:MAG: hypothetical protein OXG04_22760 [Acidobacteria bacterium]|nr:hypothetical protein [Acidobacteriota bacterium]